MIKARLVEKEFGNETRKGELFARTPGPSAPRYLVSKLATDMCGEERKCVGVMDVKIVFFTWSCSTTRFHRGYHGRPKKPVAWCVGKSGGVIVRDT